MRKALRKIIISIISVMIVLITMVATTYAWVGMLSNSTVGGFNINLKTENKDSNYSLYISSTGDYSVDENNVVYDSFKERLDSSDLVEIKKQILKNMNKYNDLYLNNDNAINTAFNRINLFPTSANVTENKVDLSKFYAYNYSNKKFDESLDYFKFDIYLSVDSTNGEITASTNYLLDLYINNIADCISGQTVTGNLVNPFEYTTSYLDNIILPAGFSKPGKKITTADTLKSNSAYSTRVAVEYYEGIPIDEAYTGSEKPIGEYVYQPGTQDAMYDDVKGEYSFGGILKTEDNLAVSEFNTIYGINLENEYNHFAKVNSLVDFDTLYNVRKNDLLLKDENKAICNDPSILKLGIINGKRYKNKITLYFWYEGWDADCFSIIDKSRTSMSLSFTSSFEDN